MRIPDVALGPVTALRAATVGGRAVLVSSGFDGAVRLWDASTGGAAGPTITGHAGPVASVDVADVGGRTLIVSGGADGTVRRWDAASCAPVGSPWYADPLRAAGSQAVRQVRFVGRGDDSVVLALDRGGRIRRWRAQTGVEMPLTRPLEEVDAQVAAVARGLIVTGHSGGQVQRWDDDHGDPIGRPLGRYGAAISAVAVAELRGRRLIVSADVEGLLRIWDAEDGEPRGDPIHAHPSAIHDIQAVAQPDRLTLVTAGEDGTVRRWDLDTGKPWGEPLTGHAGPVTTLAATETSGRHLIAGGGQDGTIRRWDALTGKPVAEPIAAHFSPVRALATVTVQGRPLVVTTGSDRTLRRWDARTGQPVGLPLSGHTGRVNAVTVSAIDGRQVLVSSGDDRTVRLWDATSGEAVATWATDHSGPVTALLALPADGAPTRLVVTGSDDGTVLRWDADRHARVGDVIAHGSAVTGLAAAEVEGRERLLSAGADGAVRCWDASTGLAVFAGPLGYDRTSAMAVIPLDGRPVLVAAGTDSTVSRWDALTGEYLDPISLGHDGPVHAVVAAVLDQRAIIVTAGDDGTLRLWEAAGGQALAVFLAHPGGVLRLALGEYAPGDPFVVSGGMDGELVVLRLRDLATARPVGVDEVFAGENTGTADQLRRGWLAAHLSRRIRQLTTSQRSASPAAGDLTGSAIIHVDGRWGAGKTTLIEQVLRDGRENLGDPVVVRYDAWRQAAVAPEWWSVASEVRRAVHASRALPVRAVLTLAEVGRRLGRSTSTWTAFLVVVAAGLVGRWLVTTPTDAPGRLKATLGLATTVSGLLAIGFVFTRSLFWTAPVLGRLHLRTDDNPLGEISGIVGQMRRWTPREGVHQRPVDWAVTVWLMITGALVAFWRPALDRLSGWALDSVTRRVLTSIDGPGALLLGLALAALVIRRVRSRLWDRRARAWRENRTQARRGAARDRQATVDAGPDAAATSRPSPFRWVHRPEWGWKHALTLLAVAAAALALSPLLASAWRAGTARWDPTSLTFALLFLAGLLAYALELLLVSHRPRRMVLLVIDDLDRCTAERVVRLLETVHTVLRERSAPTRARTLRSPAPFGVIVLASGRWVRDAFATQYASFDRQATEETVHDLGADFLQKIFDHSVLVPALSPEQTETLIHAVSGSGFYAPPVPGRRRARLTPGKPPTESGPQPSSPSAYALSEPSKLSPSEPSPSESTQPTPAEPTAPGPEPSARAEIGAAELTPSRPSPDTATVPPFRHLTAVSEPLVSGAIPDAPAGGVPAAAGASAAHDLSTVARTAEDDLGVNAQLLVTHLLTDYAPILPGNPRLIIRVASAWAMLRAVARTLDLEIEGPEAGELLVRAAVLWVRFPVLVDELVDADRPPVVDPHDPDCPARWKRRDVQQVLTLRNGSRMKVEDLAPYFGTFFAPPVAPPQSPAASADEPDSETAGPRTVVDLGRSSAVRTTTSREPTP